jgi:hypothetical protein
MLQREYTCQGIFVEGNVNRVASASAALKSKFAAQVRLKLRKLADNAALFISVGRSYRHARNSINVSVC